MSQSKTVPTRRALLRAAAFAAAVTGTGTGTGSRKAVAATFGEIKQRGHLVVATEDDFRPFEFVKDGKPTGYDSDLLDLLRKSSAMDIRQEMIPWTGLLPGVASGKYDAAVTAALISKDRQQFLDFSSPVAEATDYYVKRKGDASITGIKDLSGKKLGCQTGSAMLARLPELEDMLKQTGGKLGEVVQYVSYPEAYQDLAIGRTAYVVNTIINLDSLVKERPNMFELGQPVSSQIYIGWAVKKGNAELLQFLDDFLLAQRKNGQMYALQAKWFGKSFENMPQHFESEI